MLEKVLTGMTGSLRAVSYPLCKKTLESKTIVACVFSTGEKTEEHSIASVRRQTCPIKRIEIIRNVSPISSASNRALELSSDADFILWVDADMILNQNCAKSLLRLMRPNTLYAVAPLLDPVFGNVGYIKLLNNRMVKDLNLYFKDILGCDVDFCNQARKINKDLIIDIYKLPRLPLGIHHPTYTAQELFRKNQIEKKKRGNKIHKKLLTSLVKQFHKSANPVLLAGILGELLPNPDNSEGESTPVSGLSNWNNVRTMLGNIPEEITYGFENY